MPAGVEDELAAIEVHPGRQGASGGQLTEFRHQCPWRPLELFGRLG